MAQPGTSPPAPFADGIAGAVPCERITVESDRPVRKNGKHVVYWCIAARRTRSNFALQRALELARECGRPLVVFEPLRADYRWASDRLHAFVLQGMADNARAFAGTGILFAPYVEPEPGAGRGLLEALAKDACAVVTDRTPIFFLPRMVDAAALRLAALGTRLEAVDSNGLLPLGDSPQVFATAYAFRRHLQKHLGPHLSALPEPDPLRAGNVVPHAGLATDVAKRLVFPNAALLEGSATALAQLPIDHSVAPSPVSRGGPEAGRTRLVDFLARRLERYASERSEPASDASSGLSPYLHFGHIGAAEVFTELAAREGWDRSRLSVQKNGKRAGWWGMDEPAESFLDELITWRELGFQCAAAAPETFETYAFQPEFAQRTLARHASDPREHLYSLDDLAAARTHDPLWNAAQRQLLREGHMHNYLRMLWGKKVLEWSPTPEEAFDRLVELNNRFALDGRDPNSYSGIGWVLGRFDRPWGPERPVFGTVRYMSSANTARKLDVDPYLAKYGAAPGLFG